jgi:hypothetical protein
MVFQIQQHRLPECYGRGEGMSNGRVRCGRPSPGSSGQTRSPWPRNAAGRCLDSDTTDGATCLIPDSPWHPDSPVRSRWPWSLRRARRLGC